jgi:hypothetical protein
METKTYILSDSTSIKDFSYIWNKALTLGIVESSSFSTLNDSTITCYTKDKDKLKQFEEILKE